MFVLEKQNKKKRFDLLFVTNDYLSRQGQTCLKVKSIFFLWFTNSKIIAAFFRIGIDWYLIVFSATGADYAGCDMPCAQTKFGCCDDKVTSAHGPLKEGCCLNSEFGCCPDNIAPANGPKLEGCSCEYGPFGCCPDNSTSARGPNFQGCGCLYTEFTCCPDSYTPAAGPNYQGCGCNTFEFGCCPDLITVAKGPNLEGCGCENTAHGCCQDERTPAHGPQFEGCTCESSKYGCCLDGITASQGPNYEGCAEKPPLSGGKIQIFINLFVQFFIVFEYLITAICALDKDRGSCRNFTVKWFFDMEYGGCSRFWYGGCDGNDNRFPSQDDCKAHCVEPTGIRNSFSFLIFLTSLIAELLNFNRGLLVAESCWTV